MQTVEKTEVAVFNRDEFLNKNIAERVTYLNDNPTIALTEEDFKAILSQEVVGQEVLPIDYLNALALRFKQENSFYFRRPAILLDQIKKFYQTESWPANDQHTFGGILADPRTNLVGASGLHMCDSNMLIALCEQMSLSENSKLCFFLISKESWETQCSKIARAKLQGTPHNALPSPKQEDRYIKWTYFNSFISELSRKMNTDQAKRLYAVMTSDERLIPSLCNVLNSANLSDSAKEGFKEPLINVIKSTAQPEQPNKDLVASSVVILQKITYQDTLSLLNDLIKENDLTALMNFLQRTAQHFQKLESNKPPILPTDDFLNALAQFVTDKIINDEQRRTSFCGQIPDILIGYITPKLSAENQTLFLNDPSLKITPELITQLNRLASKNVLSKNLDCLAWRCEVAQNPAECIKSLLNADKSLAIELFKLSLSAHGDAPRLQNILLSHQFTQHLDVLTNHLEETELETLIIAGLKDEKIASSNFVKAVLQHLATHHQNAKINSITKKLFATPDFHTALQKHFNLLCEDVIHKDFDLATLTPLLNAIAKGDNQPFSANDCINLLQCTMGVQIIPGPNQSHSHHDNYRNDIASHLLNNLSETAKAELTEPNDFIYRACQFRVDLVVFNKLIELGCKPQLRKDERETTSFELVSLLELLKRSTDNVKEADKKDTNRVNNHQSIMDLTNAKISAILNIMTDQIPLAIFRQAVINNQTNELKLFFGKNILLNPHYISENQPELSKLFRSLRASWTNDKLPTFKALIEDGVEPPLDLLNWALDELFNEKDKDGKADLLEIVYRFAPNTTILYLVENDLVEISYKILAAKSNTKEPLHTDDQEALQVQYQDTLNKIQKRLESHTQQPVLTEETLQSVVKMLGMKSLGLDNEHPIYKLLSSALEKFTSARSEQPEKSASGSDTQHRNNTFPLLHLEENEDNERGELLKTADENQTIHPREVVINPLKPQSRSFLEWIFTASHYSLFRFIADGARIKTAENIKPVEKLPTPSLSHYLKSVFLRVFGFDGYDPSENKALALNSQYKEIDAANIGWGLLLASLFGLPNRPQSIDKPGRPFLSASQLLLTNWLGGWTLTTNIKTWTVTQLIEIPFKIAFVLPFNILRALVKLPINLIKLVTDVTLQSISTLLLTGVGQSTQWMMTLGNSDQNIVVKGVGIALLIIAGIATALAQYAIVWAIRISEILTSPVKSASKAYAAGRSLKVEIFGETAEIAISYIAGFTGWLVSVALTAILWTLILPIAISAVTTLIPAIVPAIAWLTHLPVITASIAWASQFLLVTTTIATASSLFMSVGSALGVAFGPAITPIASLIGLQISTMAMVAGTNLGLLGTAVVISGNYLADGFSSLWVKLHYTPMMVKLYQDMMVRVHNKKNALQDLVTNISALDPNERQERSTTMIEAQTIIKKLEVRMETLQRVQDDLLRDAAKSAGQAALAGEKAQKALEEIPMTSFSSQSGQPTTATAGEHATKHDFN
ncbi:MAG: hypothetical protein K2X50_05650 [Gammaproteobacteria bacterium]|nr:hypothetical protein [Gammaproteobacteria bacterium]